jgi:hypothetical protein
MCRVFGCFYRWNNCRESVLDIVSVRKSRESSEIRGGYVLVRFFSGNRRHGCGFLSSRNSRLPPHGRGCR